MFLDRLLIDYIASTHTHTHTHARARRHTRTQTHNQTHRHMERRIHTERRAGTHSQLPRIRRVLYSCFKLAKISLCSKFLR